MRLPLVPTFADQVPRYPIDRTRMSTVEDVSARSEDGRNQLIQALLPENCPPRLRQTLVAHILGVVDKASEYCELAEIGKYANEVALRIFDRRLNNARRRHTSVGDERKAVVLKQRASSRESSASHALVVELMANKKECKADLEKSIGDFSE